MKLQVLRGCVLSLAFLSTVLPARGAWADDEPEIAPSNDKTSWGVGVALGLQKSPYTGSDTKARALPIFFIDNKWVRVMGPNIDGKLGAVGDVSFVLRARLGLGDGYKSSDADILGGMDRRKGSMWIGSGATWRGDIVNISGEILADGSQHSKGQQATINVSKNFRSGKFGVIPNIGATWLSAQYVDYYYGVQSSEARNGRPAYDGKSTVNVTTGIRFSYDFTKQHTASVDVGVRYFGDAIVDSPLVERRTQPLVRVGYLYRF